MSTKKSLLILLFYFISNQILSQSNNFYSASNISSMLEKLDVFGKVLYIAAHPDDENTRLIAYLANEKKYETAYLSATRGGGGQNFEFRSQPRQAAHHIAVQATDPQPPEVEQQCHQHASRQRVHHRPPGRVL